MTASAPLLLIFVQSFVSRSLVHPGATGGQLSQAVNLLETLWREVVSLTGNFYKPKYSLRGDVKSEFR